MQKNNDTVKAVPFKPSFVGGQRHHRAAENFQKALIWISAFITVAILAAILIYILGNGIPQINWTFLSTPYSPSGSEQGILPMIINTLYMVILTLLIATPLSLATAIYLTQYAKPGKMLDAIRFTTEVLAGIPSILFGLVGFAVLSVTFQMGYSILAGSLTMTIMVLPLIVRTTEEALLAVPTTYSEGALALGANKLRVIWTILLPSAMPGILTAVILAMGRVVGESAALIFTLGMGFRMPEAVLGHIMDSGRTLTLHLYTLFSTGLSLDQAFGTAAVLLILVFLLNLAANSLTKLFKKD